MAFPNNVDLLVPAGFFLGLKKKKFLTASLKNIRTVGLKNLVTA